jgi:hypothetical protein
MKLTDQEIIEARKSALENNPRSYEAWYEVLTFGREVEKKVLEKQWLEFSKASRPAEEGWYAVAARIEGPDGWIYVTTAFWSNARNIFSEVSGGVPFPHTVLRFKKMSEFIDEAGLNPPVEEEGSLAQQGVEDGENK